MGPCVARLHLLSMQATREHQTHTEVLLGKVPNAAGRCPWGRLSSLVLESHCLGRHVSNFGRATSSVYRMLEYRAMSCVVKPTLVEHVAERTVVQYHHLAQIRLDRAEILNERPVPERAMLPVVPCRKEFPLRLEPVDDRIRVFLYRSREHNEVEPFAHLLTQK